MAAPLSVVRIATPTNASSLITGLLGTGNYFIKTIAIIVPITVGTAAGNSAFTIALVTSPGNLLIFQTEFFFNSPGAGGQVYFNQNIVAQIEAIVPRSQAINCVFTNELNVQQIIFDLNLYGSSLT